MTVGHKAGHYCHFRVLRSVNTDTGRKKKEKKKKERKKKKKNGKVLEFIGRGMIPSTSLCQG